MSHGTTGGNFQWPIFLGCYFQHSGYLTLTKRTKEKNLITIMIEL